jgi:hypothetical protein
MLRGFGFGVVVPSGAEWYVLVPKMCPYCARLETRFAESAQGEESFAAQSFHDRTDDLFHAIDPTVSFSTTYKTPVAS